MRVIADLQAEVAAMRAQLATKDSRIAEQHAEIAGLKRRLALDSSNSSKPPSSDSPFRKPMPRSQREASGRAPGGQAGHDGSNLEPVADPDHVIEHRPPIPAPAVDSH
ncbi:DUF6444 domain-containing protein [Streptomyces sp. NPDC087659]|uniref:DUF6444 domain-containing protein n=1 Tax=Streptomyces sp. NPDC087659 TaxID=3365801 RepID=UPI003800C83D